jgi:6-phosphogluconate dehydrogenase-like protein
VKPVVAIGAPGAMGSAVAKRLHDHDVEVLTTLAGRSGETVQRAKAAGMTALSRGELARADIFLSIVPPGAATSVAEEIAGLCAESTHKPLYVDCNAINPNTAARVAKIVEHAGMRYADAGIIGGPPKRGYDGPTFYLSGEHAIDAVALRDFGLDCRVLGSGPFAATGAEDVLCRHHQGTDGARFSHGDRRVGRRRFRRLARRTRGKSADAARLVRTANSVDVRQSLSLGRGDGGNRRICGGAAGSRAHVPRCCRLTAASRANPESRT